MKTVMIDEYRISPRVVLRPGDRFRVGRGPYWRTATGDRVPVAVRGVCTLVAVLRQGSRTFLVARNGDFTVVLHVEGRRKNPMMPELVCRPYTVRRIKKT